jgi:TrmH family RNA methyltransferase
VRAPSGLVAIAQWQPAPVESVFTAPTPFVLALVDVQDPGNVGAVIRSADALGATAVVALDATADPAGWRALRGAMGSTFRIAVGRGSLGALVAAARRHEARLVATVAGGGVPLEAADLSGARVVLLGNEGTGLAEEAVAAADSTVWIPMRPGTSSLNVAVAASIILWAACGPRAASRPSP